ncbi:MAG: Hsp20/alpha crystallin family protein, partial [Methanothrix sp.]|uniref:Hsp20/alpha crystallin family protein n=1 Tax=Methanothrix sp. TaxID=90426 RepID=UPI0031645313|nr:Hsp20/alpha crystallin family protein [Methanothrix sp.]
MSDSYEDRLDRIERRLDEIERALKSLRGEGAGEKKTAEEPSIVGEIVSQFIPGLGGIIKALEASSPEFKRRIAETDAEVRHRIEVGWSSRPVVDYNISVRPLSKPGARRPPARPPDVRIPAAPRKEPIVDVMDDGESITIVAELPGVDEDELSVTVVREGVLEIRAGEFLKLVKLPPDARNISSRSFKNGILQLRIDRVRG